MNINNRKSAILTFDYEVFLGQKTGTTDNCVVKPTQAILKILMKNKAKAIFFVDSTWLIFLKENFPEEFTKISDQIREIIQSGSTVELHLHPQWLNARRVGDHVVFKSLEHYKLESLNRDQIHLLFKNSIDLLESITNTKVRCFRAGGFCVEPFQYIRDAFKTFGITYDFSVAPGAYLREGKLYDFDFSTAPRLAYYKFNNDINKVDSEGPFREFTLGTYKTNPMYLILNKVLLELDSDRIFGDGIGVQYKPLISGKSLKRLWQLSSGILSLDKTSRIFFKYLLGTHFRGSSPVVILSHPKTVSRAALDNLNYVTRNYKLLNTNDLEYYFSSKV